LSLTSIRYSLLAERVAKWQKDGDLEADYTDAALEKYYVRQQDELSGIQVELMTRLSGNEEGRTSAPETLAPFFEDPSSYCTDLAGLSDSFRLKLLEMLFKLVGDIMYKEDNYRFHSSNALRRLKETAFSQLLSPSVRQITIPHSPVSMDELHDWPYKLHGTIATYVKLASDVGAATSAINGIGEFLCLLSMHRPLLLIPTVSNKHRRTYKQLLSRYCQKRADPWENWRI
jgi:hypothetical protein